MPPPSFSHNASASAAHAKGEHAPSINDLPKAHRGIVRDVVQNVRASLSSPDSAKPATASRATAAAYQSIQRLLAEPGIERQAEVGSNAGLTSTNMTATLSSGVPNNQSGSRNKGADEHRQGAGQSAGNGDQAGPSLRAQISTLLEVALFDIFSDEMDQGSSSKCQLLVSYLFMLRPILDPLCVVREWWDVLLRPILKDPRCHPEIARRAQHLVIWTMSCTPVESYIDEGAPSAVWPPTEQSMMAAEEARNKRKPGAAPYPVSSTRSVSPGRSSQSSEARRSTLFSAVKRPKDNRHPLWRFTHRVFDMYTTEASSASVRSIEEDDIKDMDEDEKHDGFEDNDSSKMSQSIFSDSPMPTSSSDTGPTWKGNLEAIVLAFGEERPKAFFHHLSDAFMEPQARIPILLLLTIFFRISSLHAYHVVSTPFVRLLLLSLQLDTSKTCAALGVYALATLIPHIPNWIANGGAGGLPALLSILARIIDWRKLGPRWEERSIAIEGNGMDEVDSLERISRRLRIREDIKWERLDTRSDSTTSPAPPDAELLFTFLYGIFPCNVIRFLRGPLNYLRRAEYESPFEMDWEDIIDEEAVQHKCAPILRRHILHPSLVDMDAEREISDKQRWWDHDAADITAECVCLNVKQARETYASAFEDKDVRPLSLPGALLSRHSNATIVDKTIGKRRSMGALSPLRNQHVGSWQPDLLAIDLFTTPHGSPMSRRRSMSDSMEVAARRLALQDARDLPEDFSPKTSTSAILQSQVAGSPKLDQPLDVLPSARRPSNATEVENLLQNHIRLRYGITQGSPLGGLGTLSAELMSHSPSARSHGTRSPSLSRNDQRTSMLGALPMSAENGLRAIASRSVSNVNGLIAHTSTGDRDNSNRRRAVLRDEVIQNIAYLKQENLQLRNELNYEIGQKDQMLRHIGRIHRDRIKDTAREDERQNLYQLVRALRAQLKTVRENAERGKSEALSFKSRHSRWEDELNAKVKQFREERRIWTNEVRQLQIMKEDREALIAKLEKQLHENADEVFEMRQQNKRDAQKIKAIHSYEERCKKLESCLELWDDDMRKFEAQRREANLYAHRCEELGMLLEASDAERRKAEARAYAAEAKSETLARELQAANDAVERLQVSHERLLHASEKGDIVTAQDGAEKPISGDKHAETPSARANELPRESTSLRARLEKLEAEVLDLRAKNEEWQMQTLLDRLQAERSAGVAVALTPSTAVATPQEAQDELVASVTALDLNAAEDAAPHAHQVGGGEVLSHEQNSSEGT